MLAPNAALDASAPCAAGVIHVAPDGDILLLRRSSAEKNYAGHWALPGGGAEPGETPEQAAERECAEEIGEAPAGRLKLVDRRTTPTGMTFHTFVRPVTEKFAPRLNGEHTGYAWAPLHQLPEPLHPSVRATLSERVGAPAAAGDMTPEDWQGLREGFARWTIEEEGEPEHAADADPMDWGADLDDLPIDRDHDGPWMSCMARDGSRMYVNRNLPRTAEIADTTVDVGDMLKHHEAPEWVGIRRLLAEFEAKFGREPDEEERVEIYQRAHTDVGTPSERAHAKAQHVDWPAWSAWCRGEEARLEKGPFKNQPDDADVVLAPHRHGDLEVAMDRWPRHLARAGSPTDSVLRLALDRASARVFDRDGRMRLDRVHISKANVCPYRGAEIPGWKELGLDPDRVYNLYRDPDELKKAAESSNGVQLLRKHVPVSAEDAQQWDVVGATGTDGEFDGEYLDNSIAVWTREAIDGIESDRQKELSMGYHYRADMTPGKIGDTEFDGVMRDIVVNHVALVEEGRAGPDVVVGDSMEGINVTAKKPTRIAALALGFTARAVNPLLAADAKVNYLPIFAGLTTTNFDHKKVAADVRTLLKGKTIAQDASMEHVSTMLEALEHAGKKNQASADESVSEPQHKAMEAAAHGTSNLGIPKDVGKEFADADKGKTFHDAVPEFLRGKGMSEDDIGQVMGMLPKPATAGDEEDEEAKKKAEQEAKAKKDGEEKAMDEKLKGMVSKQAMDEAIQAAVAGERRNGSETRAALDFVRPWVGELSSTLALDSAEKVHRQCLRMMGVDGADTIHASALPAVIKAHPKPGASRQVEDERPLATDSATRKGFGERFGDAGRIKAA